MPSAHCAINCLPTAVEPVKLSLRTFGLPVISLPIAAASCPVTMFSTPSGNPARCAMMPMASAEYGVWIAGLQTTVHPAASAGPILRPSIAEGKFHGVIAATTPTGWRKVRMRLSLACAGITSPSMRLACSPNHSRKLAEYATSPRASASGLPCSAVISRARSSWCCSIRSAMCRSTCARSLAVLRDHAGNAAWAASMAARVSVAPMSGTCPSKTPLAGLRTSQRVPSSASHHRPAMKACSRSRSGSDNGSLMRDVSISGVPEYGHNDAPSMPRQAAAFVPH